MNRHATAVLADVGTPKVSSIERVLRGAAKWVEIDSRIDIWRKEEGGKLLDGMDWVIGDYLFESRHFLNFVLKALRILQMLLII